LLFEVVPSKPMMPLFTYLNQYPSGASTWYWKLCGPSEEGGIAVDRSITKAKAEGGLRPFFKTIESKRSRFHTLLLLSGDKSLLSNLITKNNTSELCIINQSQFCNSYKSNDTSTLGSPQSCAASLCGLRISSSSFASLASLALVHQKRLFHQKVKDHAEAEFVTFDSVFCEYRAPQRWWNIVGN
jgi:hypothetical protein